MNLRDRRTLLFVAYCAIVALLIIGIALIFRPNHSQPTTAKHSTTTKSHSVGSSVAGSGNSKLPSSSSSSTAAHPAAHSTATQTTTALSNSGPGNVIGLFAAASIVGALFWRHKLVRNVLR